MTAARWTTPEMLAIEADAIDRALAGPRTVAVHPQLVDAAIAARPSISREQAGAVRSITTAGDSVSVVVGHAGVSKTFSLNAGAEAWRNTGLRPTGLALAGRAAAELQAGSGIPSQTIASFLKHLIEGRALTDRYVLSSTKRGCGHA